MKPQTSHLAPPSPAGGVLSPNPFSNGAEVPWCNGCSYIQLNEKIQAALAERHTPREVVLVSDIGCIGIVDKLYTCDTVHCLHGRSVPLATGLKMAHGNPNLKVIVFIGDGGASIGLQHLIESARLNADLTVFAFDNQNYGMTGGQHSTFTLPEIKTSTTPEGSAVPAIDMLRILEPFPWTFRARLTANDAQIPAALGEALAYPGFSYLETLNFCSSYAGKNNPSLALSRAQRFCESSGRTFGVFPGEPKEPHAFQARPVAPEALEVRGELPAFEHALDKPVRIVIGGSAGGGVQTATTLFTQAAVKSGLHISLKSDYPVTVGRGHSTCEVILSPHPISFAGITHPDLAIVCTEDGQRALGTMIATAKEVVAQPSLALKNSQPVDFQKHGHRNSAFHALATMLAQKEWFPTQALRNVVEGLESEQRKKALLKIMDEEGEVGGD